MLLSDRCFSIIVTELIIVRHKNLARISDLCHIREDQVLELGYRGRF